MSFSKLHLCRLNLTVVKYLRIQKINFYLHETVEQWFDLHIMGTN